MLGLALAAPFLALPGATRAQPAEAPRPIRIIAFGDSLTAGYGLAAADGFAPQLERALKARGHTLTVINAGVSGDTTTTGLQRLDWAIPAGAEAVIVELGANDALRGADPARARANLDEIVKRIKAKGAEVLIAGMQAPRNLGEAYVAAFDSIYPELAMTHGTLLYPFFLEGVAMRPELNLPDGIHPTAAGIAVIVAGILPKAEALIARVEARRIRGG
ncbi:MAG TPA: arylesterase [Hyphomicrobiaceae bacterium]|nr:arylesterase [Hyphomicrobiaceae bacterium]